MGNTTIKGLEGIILMAKRRGYEVASRHVQGKTTLYGGVDAVPDTWISQIGVTVEGCQGQEVGVQWLFEAKKRHWLSGGG